MAPPPPPLPVPLANSVPPQPPAAPTGASASKAPPPPAPAGHNHDTSGVHSPAETTNPQGPFRTITTQGPFTGIPQTAGGGHAPPAHAPPVVPAPPPAAEPTDTRPMLLTVAQCQELMQHTNQTGAPRKGMREAMKDLSDSHPATPSPRAHPIPAYAPWEHYVAQHELSARIVGSGIVRAQLVFQDKIREGNRRKEMPAGRSVRQLRLDYEFENADGQICQLHPGRTAAQDARPIFRP